MQQTQTLIDKAKSVFDGNGRELARQMHEDPAFLNRIANGKAPMPPGLAARLANTGGLDPLTATLNAVIEAEKDPEKRAAIVAALGMTWVAEAVRFELTEGANPRRFSRPVP